MLLVASLRMPQEILLLGDAMPQLLMSASGCGCLQRDRTGLILALLRFMEWENVE